MLNNTRLIIILKSLTTKELRSFHQFVISPFHNGNQKVVDLFNVLRKISSDFKGDLPKTKVAEQFLGSKYKNGTTISTEDSRKINGNVNRLLKVVEEFLIYREISEKTVLKKRLLLDALHKQKLLKESKPVLNQAKNLLKKEDSLEWRSYNNKFIIDEFELHYNLGTKSYQNEVGFNPLIKNFQHYSIGGLLRLYCAAIGRTEIIKTQFDFPFLKHLEAYIEENLDAQVPSTLIYYYILKIQKQESSETEFNALMDLLKAHRDKFPPHELRTMYGFAINFCHLAIRTGKLEYRDPLFNIYTNNLNYNVWADTFITKQFFILIIQYALSLKKIDWTNNFIIKYQDKLPPKDKTEAILLGKAFLAHATGDYSDATQNLSAIGNTQNVAFNLYIRKLEIQIAYDSTMPGEHYKKVDSVEAQINKLRFYIRDRGVNPSPVARQILDSYLRFHNITRRLFRQKYLKEDSSPVILNNILATIEDKEMLVNRHWLLEKFQELFNK